MLLNLSQIGQIALPVSDIDRAEAFYGKVLGLRKLYRFGDLTFFDCAGVRLLLEKSNDMVGTKRGCTIFAARTLPLRSPNSCNVALPSTVRGRSRFVDGVFQRPRWSHLGSDAGSTQGLRAAANCELGR
jgi:catechol 2,3-dioxygenase-like lactoylglutathione lyase family enzyme